MFRAETHEEMLAWYHDIEQLVKLPYMSLSQRQTFIASHAPEDVQDRKRQSGSSSPGLDEDEADEVPYSQINSIEDSIRHSPRRPPPGGSFPSETKLDDSAMYSRHSPVGSDIMNEIHPAKIPRDGDVAAGFGAHGLERPTTGGTGVSRTFIDDDKDFSTRAAAAATCGRRGVRAAALTDAAAVARKHRGDEEDTDQELEHGDMSDTVVGLQEAARYYAGTAATNLNVDTAHGYPESNSQGVNNWIDSQRTANGIGGALVGEAGGFLGGLDGVALVSADEKESDERKVLEQADATHSADMEVETKLPIDNDVLSEALNSSTAASTLEIPKTNAIRRSKSIKEIVEETIAESPGNHPERSVTPGRWPETPPQELDQDRMLR